jgi:hypothetical protein
MQTQQKPLKWRKCWEILEQNSLEHNQTFLMLKEGQIIVALRSTLVFGVEDVYHGVSQFLQNRRLL